MEKKTMGSFIATLRKANGMTQKDLAEKLNVSDKAVSRWERDENAPDLSLIPIIAEIFKVSADELLRGEKMNSDKVRSVDNSEEIKSSPKIEKQLKYIMNDSKNKFEIRSMFSIALVTVGFIIALLVNFAFHRAMAGFYVATIVYVVALFCEIAFYKMCENSLKTNEFEGAEIEACRVDIVIFLEKIISVIASVFAFTIPLCSVPVNRYGGETYIGINMELWIMTGVTYVLVTTGFCILITTLINKYILCIERNPVIRIEVLIEKMNKKLVGKLVIILVILYLVESLLYSFDPTEFAKGRNFDNYKDFVTYIETENTNDNIESITTGKDYYVDSDLGSLDKEKIYNNKGKLLVSFYHINQNVVAWTYKHDEDCLPITVYTSEEYEKGELINSLVMIAVGVLGIGLSVYSIRKSINKKKK